jgi:hypothetical protein
MNNKDRMKMFLCKSMIMTEACRNIGSVFGKRTGGFYIVVSSGDVQNMSTLEQNI